MNINELAKWIGIIMALVGSVSSYAVNDYKVDEAVKDIKDLQKDKEQTIRMEVRQEQIQKDVEEIKQLLKDISK